MTFPCMYIIVFAHVDALGAQVGVRVMQEIKSSLDHI